MLGEIEFAEQQVGRQARQVGGQAIQFDGRLTPLELTPAWSEGRPPTVCIMTEYSSGRAELLLFIIVELENVSVAVGLKGLKGFRRVGRGESPY